MKARVQLRLPELGVGIGPTVLDGAGKLSKATVVINNRVHHSEFDAVAIVPVVPASVPVKPAAFRVDECDEPFSSCTYRLYRRHAPDDRRPPRAEDIEDSIGVVTPDAIDGRSVPKKLRLGSLWSSRATFRPSLSYAGIQVDGKYWEGPDDVGVLFVELLGTAEKLEQDHQEIAFKLADMLLALNVERCVVPRVALAPQADTQFCFAFGSCQYTAGIIDATPQPHGNAWPIPGPADKSYARLAKHVRTPVHTARPSMLIVAGDHVYVDGTAGLFDPSIDDGRYVRPYEQLYSSVYVQDVTRQIPVCTLLDDHEIVDNWENEDDEAREALSLGVASYNTYHRLSSLMGPGDLATVPPTLWTQVRRADYDFFFVDTRTGREKRTAVDYRRQTMISDLQMQELQRWLLVGKDSLRPRFVISPSILIPRRTSSDSGRSALHSDAWDGYPRSRHELLNFIAANRINNAVFLSGDEHLSMCAEAVLMEQGAGDRVVIRSIHCSGMYAPFPFANSLPEDLAEYETLSSSPAQRWSVTATYVPRGQGFALISVIPEGARYTVSVRFALDSDPLGAAERWRFTI